MTAEATAQLGIKQLAVRCRNPVSDPKVTILIFPAIHVDVKDIGLSEHRQHWQPSACS